MEQKQIARARTSKGSDLPVIDITDPRSELKDNPEDISRLVAACLRAERRNRLLPAALLIRLAARRSLLARSILFPAAEYLDGLSTYVLKLGPDNLPPPFDTGPDRRVAASPHVTAMRLRLQRLAKMAAHELEPLLSAKPDAPLHLVNIGGGPAIDSINALIVLRRDNAAILERKTTIEVLDADREGPFFGANALRALQQREGPLAGLDVNFVNTGFDWNAA